MFRHRFDEQGFRLVQQRTPSVAIGVDHLSKCYQIYDTPRARLKQFVLPRLQRAARLPQRQYFREFWALRGISVEIGTGETVGIIGRNGSGKSTLLQLICGTLSPTSGTVRTSGRIAALLELGSGFNTDFTGRENVFMYASLLGLSKSEIDARYGEIAAFADIGDFIDQPLKTYSSGMVVRLAFAVAVCVDPEILVVDEALSVGDELFQRKCFARIEEIRSRGATILLVSHSGGTIIELCDRAILLDRGELLALGPPKSIVVAYQKLLYSSPDKREQVRARLLAHAENGGGLLSDSAADGHGGESSLARQTTEGGSDFDSGLQPQSTVEYERRGAEIGQPWIEDELGRRVNVLKAGGRYIYRYDVAFFRTVESVRFGMLIRTTTGITLGGAISAPYVEGAVPVVMAGSRVAVSVTFHCYLNAGVYFCNAGVLGTIDGEQTFLHRIVDALAFRVAPVAFDLATETVNFCCDVNVQVHE
jgi:lipopolysaccharide transport system ATP-binding protein